MLRSLLFSDDRVLFDHGVEESLGRLDPRVWHPTDVAVAVIAATKYRSEALQASEKAEWQSGFHEPGSEASARSATLMWRLGTMGFRVWSDLVGATIPTKMESPYFYPHFPDEQRLLEREWMRITGRDLKSLGELDPKTRDEAVGYVIRRWREVDAASPRADLDAVRSEIERLTEEWNLRTNEQ